MEFKFRTPPTIGEVLKINNTLTVEGCEKNADFQNKLEIIIDEMGKLSAIAKGLKSSITTAKMLAHSDHVIYMMILHNSISPNFTAVGILKMGWKKMKIWNNTGTQSEATVYCLLDFYVHETRQRKGYGKRLIDYMLQDMDLDAKNLAIDKPTRKISNFMQKHYKLPKLIKQDNDVAIFEEFFHETSNEKKSHDNTRNGAIEHEPTFGRHEAHKHHDTMGEIIQGVNVSGNFNHGSANAVDKEFKGLSPHSCP